MRNQINEEELQNLKTDNNDKRLPRIVAGLDGTELQPSALGEQSLAVGRQQLMVILANIGLLGCGISIGLPTVTLGQLTNPYEKIHLNQSQASWFASINTLFSPLGGFLSSILLDKLGRKKTVIIVNVFYLISWGIMALTIQDDIDTAYLQLLISRCFSGIAIGLGSAPISVYSAEISLPKIRGRLILLTSVSIALGVLIIYLLGYFIRDDWHLISLILCGFQIIGILCLIPIPESPSWLLFKGYERKAKLALNYFRGQPRNSFIIHPEIEAEYLLMQKNIQLHSDQKKPSFFKSLKRPEVYKPLLILIGLFTFQQTTGVFVVIVYAVQIAEEAGVSIDPFLCAIFIGLARVVITFPMSVILEKWGRRGCALVSAIGMAICLFSLSIFGWVEQLQKLTALPAIAIVSFIVLSTIGLHTLPFFMISELFPQDVRGLGSGIVVAVGYFLSFVCVKIYPGLKDLIGSSSVFCIFGIMALLATVFVYFVLPETRNRTLFEIEESLRMKGNWRGRRSI